MAVLNTFDPDVGVVEHEVISAHASGASCVQEAVDFRVTCAGLSNNTLLVDPVVLGLNCCGACIARLSRRSVDLLIEFP